MASHAGHKITNTLMLWFLHILKTFKSVKGIAQPLTFKQEEDVFVAKTPFEGRRNIELETLDGFKVVVQFKVRI